MLYEVITSGKTTNLKKIFLDIKSFYLQNASNVIKGNATVYNLEKPEYKINTSIHLDLAELMPFVPDSMMNSMKGILDAEIQNSGTIRITSYNVCYTKLLRFTCLAES